MSKLIVKLKVPSEALAKLGSNSQQPQSQQRSKNARSKVSPPGREDSAADLVSENNATPTPAANGDSQVLNPANVLKRRGIPGPKPGHKRMPPAISVDGVPKPRGKPGPKKRKLDGEAGNTPAAPAQKLGPKANQGAINAGLRALDRSGAPCRRWTRKGFNVKSFTGVVWGLPSWHGLPKASDALRPKSEDDGASSEQRQELPSSAVGSDDNKSDAGGNRQPEPGNEVTSSPPPEQLGDSVMTEA